MSEFHSEIGARAKGRALSKAEVKGIEAEYRQWAENEITTLRQQLIDLQNDNAALRQHADALADAITADLNAITDQQQQQADMAIFDAHENYLIYQEDKE